MNLQHRGALAPNPSNPPVDRRVQELDQRLRGIESITSLPQTGFQRDPGRVLQAQKFAPGDRGHIVTGVIIHAFPGIHWYKVQTGVTAGWIAACKLEHTSLTPLGPSSIGAYAPNTQVLLYLDDRLNYAFILGVVPPILTDGTLPCPDWVLQGGGSGYKREQAHQFVINNLYRQGGVIDFSANRPMDGTAAEYGIVTPTGLLLSIDDAMVQLRVNEMCGLWLNLNDSYMRLAGVNTDFESIIHEEQARDDEGESHYFRGVAAYPWEALGLAETNTAWTALYADQEVQYSSDYATVDLPAGQEDTQPIYRYKEHAGYLGQGHLRSVSLPQNLAPIRQYGQLPKDEGLFREALALTGAVHITSAKSVYIGKRVRLVEPKQIKLPEDGGGDDSREDNYCFSGTFNPDAPAHYVSDVAVPATDAKSMLRVAGVQDLLAYALNWQEIHPFWYHQGDYYTPQESDLDDNFDMVNDYLVFGADDGSYMDDPAAVQLNIDPRYGDVDYFQRESFLVFHDDGTVQLGCGFGASIVLGGGNIELSAPHQIRVLPGTDLVLMADQIIGCAKGSIDLSSSTKDLRLKAENNIQILAGNSGSGGLLLESKGLGSLQDYEDNIGEDVVGSGIVLKASKAVCGILAQNIYLATGGDELGCGTIVIDADSGNGLFEVYAAEANFFVNYAFNIAFGPRDESSTVTTVYSFGVDTCVLAGNVSVGGYLSGYSNKGLLLNGSIAVTGSVLCAGKVATGTGISGICQVPANFTTNLLTMLQPLAVNAAALPAQLSAQHAYTIVQAYYQTDQLGNETTLENLHFSFRDVSGSDVEDTEDQYHVDGLEWPESRWQMLVRLDMASGGVPWTETSVSYQGLETYPYPGRTKRVDEAIFLQITALTMVDPETGGSVDRPLPADEETENPYTDPSLANWTVTAMDGNYLLIR